MIRDEIAEKISTACGVVYFMGSMGQEYNNLARDEAIKNIFALFQKLVEGKRIVGEIKGFGSRHAKFTYKQGRNHLVDDLLSEIK